MSIDAIAFLPAIHGIPVAATDAPEKGGNFMAWMQQEMANVDAQLRGADTQLQQLATGEAQSLHQVMIALEEAKISFQLLVQVRNRLLESYQEILRMQV